MAEPVSRASDSPPSSIQDIDPVLNTDPVLNLAGAGSEPRLGPQPVPDPVAKPGVIASPNGEPLIDPMIDPSRELPPATAFQAAGTDSNPAKSPGRAAEQPDKDRVVAAGAAAGEMLGELRTRAKTLRRGAGKQMSNVRRGVEKIQELGEQAERQIGNLRVSAERQSKVAGAKLRLELSEDADYIKARARHYHEERPLQAMGMVAAAAFTLGIFMGFWRR